MAHSASSRLSIVVLLLLCSFLFFWQLDAYSLFNETEAKQAEIARQIWVRQDWLTPYYNGEIYIDKPILLHWLMALGMPIVGLNEWAIRLPSAISATVLIFSTWRFVRRFAGRQVGFLTATFLAANPFTLTLGRTGQHDMLLTCGFSLALYSWFIGYATECRWGYLGFFGAIALATLTKGPIALVLSGLILLVFLAWVGQWRNLWLMPWRWGGALLGAILLPWYGLMVQVNGWDYLLEFLGYHNVDRFFRPNLQQSAPGSFYLVLLVIGFFPWHGLLPGLVLEQWRWQFLRPAHWRSKARHQQLILFMTIWLGAVVGFMSLSATKLPWYVYPGVPALAYLCAHTWQTYSLDPRRALSWSLWGIAALYLLGAVLLIWIPRQLTDWAVIKTIQGTGVPAFWSLIAGITGVITGLSALYRRPSWSWISSALSFVLIALTLIHPVMPILDKVVLAAKLQPIVMVLKQTAGQGPSTTLPVAVGIKDPSLNFYSRLDYIERVESLSQLASSCDQAERLVLIVKQKTLCERRFNLATHHPIAIADNYRVFALTPEACQSLLKPDG